VPRFDVRMKDPFIGVKFTKEQSFARQLAKEYFEKYPGGVAELVGIEGGVVSGVTNLESSGVEASDWRPRHDEQYHEA
jgi:hypothetical protein